MVMKFFFFRCLCTFTLDCHIMSPLGYIRRMNESVLIHKSMWRNDMNVICVWHYWSNTLKAYCGLVVFWNSMKHSKLTQEHAFAYMRCARFHSRLANSEGVIRRMINSNGFDFVPFALFEKNTITILHLFVACSYEIHTQKTTFQIEWDFF